MKILIAYDGSTCAKDAIQDLKYAYLPAEGVEATVLSIGEVRTPTDPALILDPTLPIISYAMDNVQEIMQYAREGAERDAEEGKKALLDLFPKWTVDVCIRSHSPATTVLEIADSWKPDLIVMGSHGRGALGRLFLGSVSLRVASEAHTSVRITRMAPKIEHENDPLILLAFDGSRSASQAVHKLLKREWPLATHLHIVTVVDVSILATPEYVWLVGSDIGLYQEMKETHIEHALHSLEVEMQKRFATVTTASPSGSPAIEILAEAKRVHTDTIFIGSRGLSRLGRMLMGSVAHGILAHAETTVEIVR